MKKHIKKIVVGIILIIILPWLLEWLVGGYAVHNDANKTLVNNQKLSSNKVYTLKLDQDDVYKLQWRVTCQQPTNLQVDIDNDGKYDQTLKFDTTRTQWTMPLDDQNIDKIRVKSNQSLKVNKIIDLGHDIFNWSRYLFFVIITLIVVLLVNYRNYWFKNVNKLFAMLAILLGSMYIFCGPVGSDTTPDEGIHYENSYKLLEHGIYQEDAAYRGLRYETGIHQDDYADKQKLISNILDSEDQQVMEASKSIYFPYSKVDYLPSSLGMKIATALFDNSMIGYYAGKFCNLLFYVLVGYLVVSTAKVGKNLIAGILLIPSCVVLGATYSLDGMIIPSLLGAISLILNVLAKREKVTLKWSLSFVGLMSIACLGKPVFAPVFLIPMVLFKRDDFQDIKRAKFNCGLSLVMVVMIASLFIPLLQNAGGPGDLRGGIVSPVQQVKYILSHLGEFIIYFTGSCAQIFMDVVMAPECYADYFYYGVSVLPGVLVFVPLVYYALSDHEIKEVMQSKQRIIFALLYILILMMICGSMYLAFTEVGKHFIVGVQARYLFPILIILLFTIGGFIPAKYCLKDTWRIRLLFIGLVLGHILMFINQYMINCL